MLRRCIPPTKHCQHSFLIPFILHSEVKILFYLSFLVCEISSLLEATLVYLSVDLSGEIGEEESAQKN